MNSSPKELSSSPEDNEEQALDFLADDYIPPVRKGLAGQPTSSHRRTFTDDDWELPNGGDAAGLFDE